MMGFLPHAGRKSPLRRSFVLQPHFSAVTLGTIYEFVSDDSRVDEIWRRKHVHRGRSIIDASESGRRSLTRSLAAAPTVVPVAASAPTTRPPAT
jgi:hypothetical protein